MVTNEETYPDLHDARIGGIDIDFERRTISVAVEYYATADSNSRKAGWIKFHDVESVSQVASFKQLSQNRSAGNISYWQPSTDFGETFIYLVHGCITVLAAPPTIVDR